MNMYSGDVLDNDVLTINEMCILTEYYVNYLLATKYTKLFPNRTDITQDAIAKFLGNSLASKFNSKLGKKTTYVLNATHRFIVDILRTSPSVSDISINLVEYTNKDGSCITLEDMLEDTKPNPEDIAVSSDSVSFIFTKLQGIKLGSHFVDKNGNKLSFEIVARMLYLGYKPDYIASQFIHSSKGTVCSVNNIRKIILRMREVLS